MLKFIKWAKSFLYSPYEVNSFASEVRCKEYLIASETEGKSIT